MSVTRHLLKDPLSHFLLIGVALFVLAYLSDEGDSEARQIITISKADIREITDSFKAAHGRVPNADELGELVEARVREKILAREAMVMGLMENDPVIHRHLSGKMQFLAEGLVDAEALTDQTLTGYLRTHEEDYRSPATISYEQIYYDPAIRGSDTRYDASEALSAIRSGVVVAAKVTGDLSEKIPRKSYSTTQPIKELFGQQFADSLMALTENEWQGPIESDLGLHLVYVSQRKKGGLAPLDSVRSSVRQAVALERYYESIKHKYAIEIATPDKPGSVNE